MCEEFCEELLYRGAVEHILTQEESVSSPEIFPDNWKGSERKVASDDDGAEDEEHDGVGSDGWPSTEM